MYLKILFLLLITEICAKPKCPVNCVCDNYLKLRRVKCTNRNLVNFIENIPPKVQVFDVSYNFIKDIGDHEFLDLGLTSMKLLNISHNKLGHIHLNGFRQMDNLKIVDLSHNVLEYLLNDWFYDLVNLKELYINNNHFASLPDGPLIESNSLEILDLSNSRIPHIKKDAFTKLPNLRKLYLDGNFLIQLKTVTLWSLQKLQTLSLQNNPLNCDKSTNELKEHLQTLNILYKDSCDVRKTDRLEQDKFQRIVKEPEKDSGDVIEWILDEDMEDDIMVTYNCSKTNDVKEYKGLLMEIIELSPILAVLIPFIGGALFGLILGCSIQIKSGKNRRRSRRNRYSIIRRNQSDCYPLVLKSETISESTPMPQRRIMSANSL